MKTSNVDPPGEKQLAASRGSRSTNLAGSKGMIWRDASTESVGQIRDITVYGAEFVDNDDGTGALFVGRGGFTDGGTGGGDGSGPYSIEEADAKFQTQYGGERNSVTTVTASGSALSLDLSTANVFDITLTANCTLSFTGTTDLVSGDDYEWTLIIRQPSSGGPFTVTWPGSVDWQDTDGTGGGAAPTLYTAATAENVVLLTTLDGGVTYGAGLEGSGSSGGGVTGFATPAIVLGTAAAAGAATTVIRSDATIVAFDATVPVTQAFSDTAATGSAAVAARRDHKHGMPAPAGTSATDTNIWRPVLDGAGAVIQDGSGQAVMAWGPA